jgi:hypothetical protein
MIKGITLAVLAMGSMYVSYLVGRSNGFNYAWSAGQCAMWQAIEHEQAFYASHPQVGPMYRVADSFRDVYSATCKGQ